MAAGTAWADDTASRASENGPSEATSISDDSDDSDLSTGAGGPVGEVDVETDDEADVGPPDDGFGGLDEPDEPDDTDGVVALIERDNRTNALENVDAVVVDPAPTNDDVEHDVPQEVTEQIVEEDPQPAVVPVATRVRSTAAMSSATTADQSAPIPPPMPKPAAGTVGVLSSVLSAVLAPLANGAPQVPAPPPVPLTLMALARRDFEGALLANSATVESVTPPEAVAEEMFTGRPSLVTQVFVAGLRLIKPVLNLFGLELNGTSARIPFFTDGKPPFFLTFGLNVTSTQYQGWKVWTLAPSAEPPDKVVVAVHGGSFIATASLFHWWTYADMVRDTGATVVVPLYPLANAEGTGGTAKTVVPTVADFIAEQVAEHGAENVSVLGDSAGGSIALAAAQLLVQRCGGEQECLDAVLPGRMVLLSPALDAGANNPDAALVNDPLLNPEISRRNGLWWAKGLETADDPDGTKNPLASPLFGSLEHLPPTAVYAGSLDSRTPDVLVLREKANGTPGAEFTFELRKGQIHDWTIFGFLPDAHAERPNIYRDLGLS